MTNGNITDWIDDGDKYALIGLSVNTEGDLPQGQITPNYWVLANTKFDVPDHWKEWLGELRTEEVKGCNLFLLSKLASLRPDVLDGENQTLQQTVFNFYIGLLLASTFAPAERPIMLTGSRSKGEIGVREQQDLDSPVPGIITRYPPIGPEEIQLAARLGENLKVFFDASFPAGRWRFKKTLTIYIETRTKTDILDHVHQYCRCLEGLILPEVGKTTKQFKCRTELFIGPKHHKMMGLLYDVRSAVEHLHEDRHLEPFDREKRLDLVQKVAIVEYIARSTISRILGNDALWPHFANSTALAEFWQLTEPERRAIWGDPIDPMNALAFYNPKYIGNRILGAS